jgi:PUA-domain protein
MTKIKMPTKRRYPLKTKEAKQILDEATSKLKLDFEQLFGTKTNVEVVESDLENIYLIEAKPLMYKAGDKIWPTLLFDEFRSKAPKIVVDMGAVPYVCKGATVMAPGIVRIEGKFSVGDLVLVCDVKFGKSLAIAEALIDSTTASTTKKGPVAKTQHWVGDKIWEYIKTLTS